MVTLFYREGGLPLVTAVMGQVKKNAHGAEAQVTQGRS